MIIQWVPGLTLAMTEKMAIQQAMQYFRGNKTATASALGIAVRTLDNKLSEYAGDEQKMKAVNDERIRQQREFYERAKGTIPAVIDGARKPAQKPQAVTQNGVHVEPAQDIAAQSEVSLPEPEKVQEVLSTEAAKGGKPRGRPSPYRTN